MENHRSHPKQQQLLAALALLLATASWGSTFFIVKRAIAEIDLYSFLFLRFSLSAVCMMLLFGRRIVRQARRTAVASAVTGIFLVIAYITQTEGLRFTSAANSALITCLYTVLIPIFLFLGLGKKSRITPSTAVGIMLSLVGMYLLTCFGLTSFNRGDLITLICAVACALHVIFVGRYTIRKGLTAFVTLQFLFVALTCGAIAAGRGSLEIKFSPFVWFALFITAIVSTVFAFILQIWAQRILPADRTGVILAMEAVFGALFAWTLGAENPTLISFAGACLMVAGMILSESNLLRKRGDRVVPVMSPP